MKIFSMLVVALLMIFQTIGFAATETFSASGEYLMSDYDTPEIAEEIALDFAKQSAAEQAGIYLESYSRSVNFDLEVDEIKTVASSKVEILEKNISRQFQDNGRILLHADIRATVDTSELDSFLNQERKERQQAIQLYKDLQKMNDEIKQDIDTFQQKILMIRDSAEEDKLIIEQERINREFLSKQKMEQVNKKSGFLEYDVTAVDEAIKINPKNFAAYVIRGLFSSPLSPDVKDMSKAIILNPNEPTLYTMRGSCYTTASLFNSAMNLSRELEEKTTDKNELSKQYLDKALNDYNTAIKLDPKNSFSYAARAVYYEALEEYNKALADYNKAIELNPKDKEVRQARGDLYTKLKDPSNAVKDYNLSQNDEKKKFDGFDYVSLGDKYKEANDYPHAIENYTKAIEMTPQFEFADHRLPAYNARAIAYMGKGEYDKALADCDTGINLAKNSSDKRAEFWVSELEARKKEIFSLQETQNIDPKDKDALLKRAWKNFVAERYDAAISDLNALVELTPEISGIYHLRARCYEKLGEIKKALEDLDKAIELKPDYSSAYEKRQELLKIMYPDRKTVDIMDLMKQAENFKENGDYNRAIKSYTEILEVEPNYQDALFHRAITYYSMEKNDLALVDYNKLLELNPNYDRAAYYNRGVIYFYAKRYDAGVSDFNRYIQSEPDESAGYFWRACCYRKLENYNAAITDYTKAIELNPNYTEAYVHRGIAYNDSGQYEKAIVDYFKALKLNPKNDQTYNNRGVSYENLKQYDKALADYNKALELDPNNETAKNNRQRVLEKMKK